MSLAVCASIYSFHNCTTFEWRLMAFFFSSDHSFFLTQNQVQVPFMTVRHEASWKIDETHPHIAYFMDTAILQWRKKDIGGSGAYAVATFVGPGGVVYFTITIPLGKIIFFQTHTPLSPLKQSVEFRCYRDPKIPYLLAMYIFGSWLSQWEHDLEVCT